MTAAVMLASAEACEPGALRERRGAPAGDRDRSS
jgi:hypothetical protein